MDYNIIYSIYSIIIILRYINTNCLSDLTNGQLTTRFVFKLRVSPITWLSKKQSIVILSFSKIKYIGLSFATRELTWLDKLTKNFGMKTPKLIPIYCNNEGNIKIATNLNINLCTRYITIYYHFTRKKLEMKEVCLIYVPHLNKQTTYLPSPLDKVSLKNLVLDLTSSLLEMHNPNTKKQLHYSISFFLAFAHNNKPISINSILQL